jgi:simple sugar transport system permease protein
VALIAGLNPAAVIASGIFFGVLQTGALALQREYAVPSSLASVAEAALILGVLTVAAYRGRTIIGLSKHAS